MRWRARIIVQPWTRPRASRPQLKRDPLGGYGPRMTDHTSHTPVSSWKTGHWRWPLAVMMGIAAVTGWLVVRPPRREARREAIDWCRHKYESARTFADTLGVDALHLGGGRLQWNAPYTLCGDYRATGMR